MTRLFTIFIGLLFGVSAFAQSSQSLELLSQADRGIIPRYLLQDPNGRSITSEDFNGRFQLISFGYTYCPDICPTTLVEMAEILKLLGDKAARIQAIFISVDPERDSGKVLKTYTEFFDARILGLTDGAPALVDGADELLAIGHGAGERRGQPVEQGQGRARDRGARRPAGPPRARGLAVGGQQRARLGDYEADLIVGYRQSGYVLTVIDRTSLATVLRRVPTKHASEILRELKVALRKLGTARTVTVDNGKEFYAHRELEKSERVRVYFTHPYCSTERGTVENANGLVRYYLPKRSSFARLSQKRLDDIEALLNDRPRRCLGYLTPREVHTKKMPSARKRALHL